MAGDRGTDAEMLRRLAAYEAMIMACRGRQQEIEELMKRRERCLTA